ncbi:MAG: glycosyltransferase [Pseudomonadota bacterium]
MANSFTILMPYYMDLEPARSLLRQIDSLYRTRVTGVVIVDDGSPEAELDPPALSGLNFPVHIVRLKRNVGHQMALSAGLAYMVKQDMQDRVVVMDSDGEDMPEHIEELLKEAGKGAQVVVARRSQRSEGVRFSIGYQVYKFLFWLLTGLTIDFGNFCVLERAAVKRLVNYSETGIHFPATVIKTGLKLTRVAIPRGRRTGGRSHLGFSGLVMHGMNAIKVFSSHALSRTIIFATGLVIALTGTIVTAGFIKFMGFASPGWLTSIVGFSIATILQTLILLMVMLMALDNRTFSTFGPQGDYADLIESVMRVEPAHPARRAAE